MERIGFLSFGHWQPDAPPVGNLVRTGRDALVQSVELAVAAEELGVDGAYVRVHHFARQLASPFPLLAAMAARTSRIEVGTGVVDMQYENPLYMGGWRSSRRRWACGTASGGARARVRRRSGPRSRA